MEQEEHEVLRYGRPSVVLFGPVPPARWGPPARPYHRVIWHGIGAEPGDAPRPGTRPAVLRISAGEVLAGAGDVERACHAVTAQ